MGFCAIFMTRFFYHIRNPFMPLSAHAYPHLTLIVPPSTAVSGYAQTLAYTSDSAFCTMYPAEFLAHRVIFVCLMISTEFCWPGILVDTLDLSLCESLDMDMNLCTLNTRLRDLVSWSLNLAFSLVWCDILPLLFLSVSRVPCTLLSPMNRCFNTKMQFLFCTLSSSSL